MTDEDEIPTLGAYVPVPPGGGGGAGGRGPWGGGDRRPDGGRDDDDDPQDNDEPADEPQHTQASDARPDDDAGALDVEVPSESLEAPAAPPAAAGSRSASRTGETSSSGARASGASGGVPSAAGATTPGASESYPPTVELPIEPGMTFVSTTGDPDTYQPPPTPRGEDDDEPTRISERFEVIKLLGKGGMGRVYRVRDRHIQGRELALKILHRKFSESPYFKELFFREIKTAQEFVSEHVNQVRDTGITDDGQLFLTMDLVDGETLRSLLRREQSLGVRHALEIVRQTLIGLQSGHEQGFIHRDVKPENIMLAAKVAKTDANPFGVSVRLLDFGLAGLAAELEEGGTHGTPMYMSPEQAQGKRLDGRSDLFAVGTVLYEMLVGSRPFHGKTVANVLTSVIETDVHPLIDQIEHVDKRVRKLLRKALAKKREDRFQSAAEFITAIEKAPAFRPPTEMPLWGTAAILVLAAGTVTGGGLWWARDGEIKSAQARNDALQGEVSARDSRIQELQGQLAAAQSKATEKGDEVVSSKVDDEAITRMQADWQAKLDLLNTQLKQATEQQDRDNKAAAEKIAELKAKAEKQEKDLAKLQQLERQTQPVPKAARGLDDILKLAEKGYLERVEGYVTSLVLADAFKADPLRGVEYLQAFGRLCTAVAAFDTADDDVLRQRFLDEGRAAMTDLLAARPQFEIVARDYLVEPTDDEPSPDRLARFDALVDGLQARLTEMGTTAAAGTESAWDKYLAAGAEQDPGPVFDLAAQTGEWGNLRTILEAYARHLEDTAVHSGVLDVDVLRADPWLSTWAGRIEKTQQAREWPRAKDVRLFEFARAWHEGGEPRRLTTAELNLPSAPLTSPRADWRWETHLAAQLTSDRAAWPLGPTKEAVYLKTSPTGNQWIKDSGKDKSGSTWTVASSIYKERGDKIDQIGTTQFDYTLHDGHTFGWDGGSIDVRSDPAKVARFESSYSGEVPSKLGVTSDEVAAFRARLAAADASERACLVYVDGKTTRWISPVLGLVREEQVINGDKLVLELVYTNVVK
ncbi:MAG: protein kinase [Planctomycetes bacterium]|nr:protein kinase [Planctomycetota bacterium]